MAMKAVGGQRFGRYWPKHCSNSARNGPFAGSIAHTLVKDNYSGILLSRLWEFSPFKGWVCEMTMLECGSYKYRIFKWCISSRTGLWKVMLHINSSPAQNNLDNFCSSIYSLFLMKYKVICHWILSLTLHLEEYRIVYNYNCNNN